MVVPPTATSDTICAALRTCDFERQEIVDPPVDSTTLADEVYASDRTCAIRDSSCHPQFESEGVLDAYATPCTLRESTSLTVRFKDNCAAINAFFSTLTVWDSYFEEKRSDGGDFYSVGDWGDSSLIHAVRGSGDTFDGAIPTVDRDGGGCNAVATVVFQAADSNTVDRARRYLRSQTSSGLSHRRSERQTSFPEEVGIPIAYTDGSKPCALDPSVDCCVEGWGAIDSVCVKCVAENFEFNNAETLVAANSGCRKQPVCDSAKFFYRNRAPSTTAEAAANCQRLTSCYQQGKLVSAHTLGEDRVCSETDIILCNAATQYWSDSNTSAFSGSFEFEWFQNPTCVTMQDCPSGTFWSNSDTSADVPFWNGVEIRERSVYVADRVCETRSCSNSQYSANFAQIELDGLNSVIESDCQQWNLCSAEQFEYIQGTAIANVACQYLDVCEDDTEFQSVAPTPTSNRYCKSVNICAQAEFEVDEPTDFEDRVCNVLQECATETEFESEEATPTTDRVCSTIRGVCASATEYESASPTYTSNRECTVLMTCDFGSQYEISEPTSTSDRQCVNLRECVELVELEIAPPTPTSDRECVNAGSYCSTAGPDSELLCGPVLQLDECSIQEVKAACAIMCGICPEITPAPTPVPTPAVLDCDAHGPDIAICGPVLDPEECALDTFVRETCPIMCGRCPEWTSPPTSVPAPTPTPTPAPAPDCEALGSDDDICGDVFQKNECGLSPFVQVSCPFMCGLCSTASPTAAPTPAPVVFKEDRGCCRSDSSYSSYTVAEYLESITHFEVDVDADKVSLPRHAFPCPLFT